ncbi:MAG TPA: DNA gyrase inhibitor YacG [Geminicoccaceae bacterium]|nr:DNA gyrase inhibitor YacG [Geminicoccaceae bacterium]
MSEDRARDEEVPSETPRCPLCGKPRVRRYRPFCSARCRDVDLGRWFDAAYAVPAAEPGYDEDEQG